MSSDDYEKLRKAVNQNRETITKTIQVYKFYDKLRSIEVLSHEDYEEIDNSTVFPTGVEKAGHLLDVVDTKGPKGLHAFIDSLHEHYPHLYQQVTGMEPVAPSQVNIAPVTIGAYNPVIDYDAVRRQTAQLDKMSRIHAADKLAMNELREEIWKLRFINTTCRAKMKNYPKILQNYRQIDLELKKEKEENFNHIISLKNHEQTTTKLRFERKEMKQLIEQLTQKLEDAVNMHASQKHNWNRTNSKNEQLTHDKNNLEKRVEHMQREIETVKRQSSLWSNRSFQLSVDQDPLASVVDIQILKSDLVEMENENKDLIGRLYQEQEEKERKEMICDKIEAEYEELKHMLKVVQKDLEVTDRNYQLTWQEVQKVTNERNQAYEQRDRAHHDAQTQRRERDRIQDRLHEQLMQFKLNLHEHKRPRYAVAGAGNKDDDLLSPESRNSNYSDSSGFISSRSSTALENDSDRRSATLPARGSKYTSTCSRNGQPSRAVSDITELNPDPRPRLGRVYTRNGTREDRRQSHEGPNPFPEDQIPLTPNVEKKLYHQERMDGKACENGCVTPDDVQKSFADRANFSQSSRSIDANYGSKKIKDHRLVGLDDMQKSFRVRPILDYSFSLDFEDESEDLKAIFAEDSFLSRDEQVKKRKKLHRLSKSLDDLNISSDDSDDRDQVARPTQPLRSTEETD